MKDKLNKLLDELKQKHFNCEDSWYSCMMADNYSGNVDKPDRYCDCGAEHHNKLVEEISKLVNLTSQ